MRYCVTRDRVHFLHTRSLSLLSFKRTALVCVESAPPFASAAHCSKISKDSRAIVAAVLTPIARSLCFAAQTQIDEGITRNRRKCATENGTLPAAVHNYEAAYWWGGSADSKRCATQDAPLGYVSTTIAGCPVSTCRSYAKAPAPFCAQNRLENTSAIRSPLQTSQPTRLCETVKTECVISKQGLKRRPRRRCIDSVRPDSPEGVVA
jgi:hypothetical protein